MKISAVLLAGGESHRMGKDKATLLFRGRPLWQIQLELLRKLSTGGDFHFRTEQSRRGDRPIYNLYRTIPLRGVR